MEEIATDFTVYGRNCIKRNWIGTPSVMLKLHCMDMRDLRKAYRDNDRKISQITKQYESRYTTKANKAIYKLMVIALRAELQNILYNLKFEKLDKVSGSELRAEVMANYLRHEHLPDGTFLSENARYQQTYGMLSEEGVIIQQSYNKSQAASFLAA